MNLTDYDRKQIADANLAIVHAAVDWDYITRHPQVGPSPLFDAERRLQAAVAGRHDLIEKLIKIPTGIPT